MNTPKNAEKKMRFGSKEEKSQSVFSRVPKLIQATCLALSLAMSSCPSTQSEPAEKKEDVKPVKDLKEQLFGLQVSNANGGITAAGSLPKGSTVIGERYRTTVDVTATLKDGTQKKISKTVIVAVGEYDSLIIPIITAEDGVPKPDSNVIEAIGELGNGQKIYFKNKNP